MKNMNRMGLVIGGVLLGLVLLSSAWGASTPSRVVENLTPKTPKPHSPPPPKAPEPPTRTVPTPRPTIDPVPFSVKPGQGIGGGANASHGQVGSGSSGVDPFSMRGFKGGSLERSPSARQVNPQEATKKVIPPSVTTTVSPNRSSDPVGSLSKSKSQATAAQADLKKILGQAETPKNKSIVGSALRENEKQLTQIKALENKGVAQSAHATRTKENARFLETKRINERKFLEKQKENEAFLNKKKQQTEKRLLSNQPTNVHPQGKLDWEHVPASGETRLAHVNAHGRPIPGKQKHGVFNGDPQKMTNEAWEIAVQKKISPLFDRGADTYFVPYKNAGWESGSRGNGQRLDFVKIITRSGTNKLISAYPSEGPL